MRRIRNRKSGLSDSTADRSFPLHEAYPGSIACTGNDSELAQTPNC